VSAKFKSGKLLKQLKDMMQVKEAVDGVGGVLKAVEAAQSSFHTLERNLLAKVVVFSLSIEKLVLGKMIFCQNYIPFLIHCSHICVAACD
jgi:hypothetical protein